MTTKETTNNRPGLRLQPGERILREGEPAPRTMPSLASRISLWFVLTVVPIPLIPLVPKVVRQYLGWHRWWLTDRRMVVRNGFIGWQISSVPLDRIVDVTTYASWWDRLWGIQHIKVRDMTGEINSSHWDSKVSTGLRLIGVEDAEDVSELILVNTPQTAMRSDDLSGVVNLLEKIAAQGV